MKSSILSIMLAGLWISISEFVRNEFLFKKYWTDHYSSLGLSFETLPINGILWFVWSLLLAFIIFKLLPKFSFIETVILTWLAAFLMMWITAYNLQVLPINLLLFAIPLSIIEILVASLIIKSIRK